MKTHVLRTSILALALTVAGHAQSNEPLIANIPFNFVAGNATLTAGQYHVQQAGSGVIRLNPANGEAGAFVLAPGGPCAGNQGTSRLVFHRYGNTYLLSQIWTAGYNCGRHVPVTARERELEARYVNPDATIIVALR